jgi:hypothetical protein
MMTRLHKTITRLVCISLLAITGCKAVSPDDKASLVTTAGDVEKPLNAFSDKKMFLPPIAERASLATKNFFSLQSVFVSEPLPRTSIPATILKDTYLSDALLQLMQNVPYRLYISDTVKDKKLSVVSLPRDFATALEQLSVEGDFVYRLNKGVLQIESVEAYSVVLPPLGYMGNNAPKTPEVLKAPYENILNTVQSLGATKVEFEAATRLMSLQLTRRSFSTVKSYLQQLRTEKMVVAYQAVLWRFDIPPTKPLDWQLMGLKKIGHDSVSGTGVYQGALENEDFRSVFAPYGMSVTKVDAGIVTMMSGSPLTFAMGPVPKAPYCKTPTYTAPLGLLTITAQSTPQDVDVKTNIFATIQNPSKISCDAKENIQKNSVSLSFTHNVETPLLLYSLSYADDPASYMILLKPRLIRFNVATP